MTEPWFIQLFGPLRATQGDRAITRFRTQKTGALLAFLAYHRGRSHMREALIEMLWPESEPESGRHNLSLALSSLRSQLEPPGVSDGSVIVADRFSVELNPEAFTTDARIFEEAVRRALQARNAPDRIELLAEAVDAFGGDLLPGYFEEWVLGEQQRLAERYAQTASQLIGLLQREGDVERALAVARQAVVRTPLHDEIQRELLRLLVHTGNPEAAVRHYREYIRRLSDELGEEPLAATQALFRDAEARISERAPRRDVVAKPLPTVAAAGPTAPPISRPALPEGTVTFLFTDIEGPTQQWEKAGALFRSALMLHHALLRREFRRFGGIEVKEAGDSFLVAFSSVSDGLACAISCQRALAAQEWPHEDENVCTLRVRMALHTGDVQLEDGEYHGLSLHRGARILASAHGGQILCSEASMALLRRDLEPDVRLGDLGQYRLRGVEEPERIFQVDWPGMPSMDFPPLHADPAQEAHLPLQFTRFFGREKEIAQILEILRPPAQTRILTLTGPGGTGKTRLAIEAAGRLAEPYAGAIWFVPLADVSEGSHLASAIVDALGLKREPNRPAIEQAAVELARQPSLLLLDNLEQLVDTAEAAETVQALMEEVPHLTILATSRQQLGVPGEQEFPVPPLSTPSRRGEEAHPEGLSAYESVRLFVDRAQAVKPDFRITNQNAPSVAELCDRLEGIPLAIELSAARALVLTPQQMLAQLANRFEFLVSSTRRRGVSERQRTLRAAIDWSYRLLAPDLQRFFARLSVFRGGFTAEAAEAVCEEPLALDFLAQLRESSLLLTEDSSGAMRFRPLEMLREYAADRLERLEDGEARDRHAAFFLDLAERAQPELTGPDQSEWLNRLEEEHDNFRAVLKWSIECSVLSTEGAATPPALNTQHSILNTPPSLALRLAVALWRFWSIRGFAREGRQVLERLLTEYAPEDGTHDGRLRAQALDAAGALAHDMADYTGAAAKLEESLAYWRDEKEPGRIANTLNLLANVRLDQGRDADAVPLYEEALTLYRELKDARGTAMVLSNLGALAILSGDAGRAEKLLEESLTHKRTLGSRYSLAIGLENLGNVERSLGNLDRALALHKEALEIRRELGHRAGVAMSCSNLGQAMVLRGEAVDFPRAAAYLREALDTFQDLGDARGLAECLMSCAASAARNGKAGEGAQLAGAAAALRRSREITLTAGDAAVHEALLAPVKEASGERFAADIKAGGRMSTEEAIEAARRIL